MLLDLIVAVALVIACFKGFSRGLIVAVFSILAFIVGLAAALKLSAVTASYLDKSTNISVKWLPVISFAVVFLLVVLLVRWGAKLVEKTFQVAMLGWVNRIGGIALYAALYLIIISIFVFYAQKINLLSESTLQASVTYPFLKPWGPKVIDSFGIILPWFKNIFGELEQFFAKMADTVPK